MPSTNKTSKGLNQWIEDDSPVMADFNKDNEIIDRYLTQIEENTGRMDGVPIGAIISFPKAVQNPAGFLKCDGKSFNINTYPELYNVLGRSSILPDMRRSDVGMMAWFPQNTIPSGWLECNGSTITSAAYPELYKYLGDKYGSNGRLPNAEDRFVRNAGNGLSVGQTQSDELKAHKHKLPLNNTLNSRNKFSNLTRDGEYATYTMMDDTGGMGDNTWGEPDSNQSSTGGDETRPKSIVFKLCIKALNSYDDVIFWIKATDRTVASTPSTTVTPVPEPVPNIVPSSTTTIVMSEAYDSGTQIITEINGTSRRFIDSNGAFNFKEPILNYDKIVCVYTASDRGNGGLESITITKDELLKLKEKYASHNSWIALYRSVTNFSEESSNTRAWLEMTGSDWISTSSRNFRIHHIRGSLLGIWGYKKVRNNLGNLDNNGSSGSSNQGNVTYRKVETITDLIPSSIYNGRRYFGQSGQNITLPNPLIHYDSVEIIFSKGIDGNGNISSIILTRDQLNRAYEVANRESNKDIDLYTEQMRVSKGSINTTTFRFTHLNNLSIFKVYGKMESYEPVNGGGGRN